MNPRHVSPADLIRIECASATLPGYEAHDIPRRWHILTTRAAIEQAETLGGCNRLVPTYQRTGEKTISMLCRMPEGLRATWKKKHGQGLVHLNYIHNARQSSRYGCTCAQCTSPDLATQLTATH
jgi:hypothetical protein